ncbi:MAG TPA: hypothetical protein VGY91_06060 [Chthoniobacterales bacterium]|nr:hypothetical protein [Chthoniobacterales bacterium]
MLFQVSGQGSKLLIPKFAVTFDPGCRIAHRFGLESQAMDSTVAMPLNESCIFEDAQVFGDSRERNRKRFRYIRDARICVGEEVEDAAAGTIGQSAEDTIE